MAYPLVAVPADTREIGGMPFHIVGDKYVRAVWEAAGCTPVILPALPESQDLDQMIEQFDGILFTGSPSNVHPSLYGEAETPEHEPYDRPRDATTFPWIAAALKAGLPSLFICRGFQELNVHFGGTLHPAIHSIPGRLDHRRPKSPELDVQYGPAHSMRFEPDSLFAKIAGQEEIMVNTVHNQGVIEVGEGLTVEGWAPDGTPEAMHVTEAKNFALAVQWHPEYKARQNDFSRKLFAAFGDAVREQAQRKAVGAAGMAAQ